MVKQIGQGFVEVSSGGLWVGVQGPVCRRENPVLCLGVHIAND